MRKRTIRAVRAMAGWIERILEARLPMRAVNGLRTR
jgi:hypothetical protein